MSKPPIPDELLELLRPQLEVAWDVIRGWPLGQRMDDLAALLVLKVIAVTSGQLKEIGLYDRIPEPPQGGPDDGGFF